MFEVFAIFDKKLGAYLKPFFAPNSAVAMRAFGEHAVAEGSEVQRHPEDFALYRLSKFEPESGEFQDSSIVFLCNGIDFHNAKLEAVGGE